MALLTGIDLSFFKDEGFKKWTVFIVGEAGIILWVFKGLMPIGDGLEYLIALVLGYTGINLGGRLLAGVQAGRSTTSTPELKP